MSTLDIAGLSAGYGAVRALDSVNLRVGDAEVVALVGPNGAGKSTLLRAISGVVKPWSGQISCDGNSITGWSPARIVRQGVVQIPEGRQILKRMTVAENLAMGAYSRRDRAAVEHDLQGVLHRFPRLRERSNQAAGALSGGEQQMLAIGRALMAKPRLLMMDEPSLGLAPVLVAELFALIGELKSSGMTMLLVEQNARQALRVADRGYVLETGRVVFEGAANELLASRQLQESYLGVA